MNVLYLFNVYLLDTRSGGGDANTPRGEGISSVRRGGARASRGGGAHISLLCTSRTRTSGRLHPSIRMLVNSIEVGRSDVCVFYSDTLVFRGVGSIRTFNGIHVRRNSALFVCKSCLCCSNVSRLTVLHRGMHVVGHGAILAASDLGCSHLCSLNCCFRNNALASRSGILASR